MHLATAARADQAVGFDEPHDARQVGRQIADGAFDCGFGGLQLRIRRHAPLLLGLFDLGQRDGEVFESQLTVVLGQLLGAFAAQRMVQFGDQMFLAAGDLFESRDLCEQCFDRRTFTCGDSREVEGGRF